MSKIKLTVVQPYQTKVKGDFDHVIIPGVDGDFGIDTGHTSFITKIRPGNMKLYLGKNIEEYAIHDGFVTVENDKVTIVCEIIERDKEINQKRAQDSKERAEKRLKSSSEEIDFRRAEIALKKALVRLGIAKN